MKNRSDSRPTDMSRRSLFSGIAATAVSAAVLHSRTASAAGHKSSAVFPSSPAIQRYQHTATLLGDGSVFIAGGIYRGVLSDAQLFNPQTGEWSSAAPMITPRYHHAAVALSPTTVLVLGGQGVNHQTLIDAEVYDYNADVWIAAKSLLLPRYQHTATALADGAVLVTGGLFNQYVLSDVEIYIP